MYLVLGGVLSPRDVWSWGVSAPGGVVSGLGGVSGPGGSGLGVWSQGEGGICSRGVVSGPGVCVCSVCSTLACTEADTPPP